jgi:hypothetical protein
VLQSPSEKQIRNLIFDRQIVSNGRLVTQYEHFNPDSFRILDQPLAILITDELIHGSWTIDELAEKFGIDNNDVRSVLLPLMSDPSAFEGCYIPRRTGRDEREGHRVNTRYSYVPIPINARIFDPTLGFSLLGWRSLLKEFNPILFISTTSELDKQYCEKISSFWEIPTQKVIDYYSKEKLCFIPSVYGIFPVIERDEIYTSIKKKVEEDPDLLSNRFRRRNLEKERLMFEQYLMQGPGTIPELQFLVVLLYDILSFCSNKGSEGEYKEFSKINFAIFQMVFNVSEIRSTEIQNTNLSEELQSLTEQDNEIVNREDREASDGVNYHTISVGNRTVFRFVDDEIAHVADSCLISEIKKTDSSVSNVVNYHTTRVGNRTVIRVVEGEIAHVADSQEVKENEKTVSIPVFHRTPIQKRDLNELIRDLESQNVSTRVSAVRRIKSGKVPTNNNLLILALNDDAWSVQIEALSAIKKQIIPVPPKELIPCVKSINKKVWRAAISTLSSMGTQDALTLLEKTALQCDRAKAKEAMKAILSGYPNNSKPILKRISELADDQNIRQIAHNMLLNLKSVD